MRSALSAFIYTTLQVTRRSVSTCSLSIVSVAWPFVMKSAVQMQSYGNHFRPQVDQSCKRLVHRSWVGCMQAFVITESVE